MGLDKGLWGGWGGSGFWKGTGWISWIDGRMNWGLLDLEIMDIGCEGGEEIRT
jgi:hypothetical protein